MTVQEIVELVDALSVRPVQQVAVSKDGQVAIVFLPRAMPAPAIKQEGKADSTDTTKPEELDGMPLDELLG